MRDWAASFSPRFARPRSADSNSELAHATNAPPTRNAASCPTPSSGVVYGAHGLRRVAVAVGSFSSNAFARSSQLRKSTMQRERRRTVPRHRSASRVRSVLISGSACPTRFCDERPDRVNGPPEIRTPDPLIESPSPPSRRSIRAHQSHASARDSAYEWTPRARRVRDFPHTSGRNRRYAEDERHRRRTACRVRLRSLVHLS